MMINDENLYKDALEQTEQDLLQICEDNYVDEDFRMWERDIVELVITSTTQLEEMIDKAKYEKWTSISIIFEKKIKLSAKIGQLKELKILEISYACDCSGWTNELPTEIGNLSNLEFFCAHSCSLEKLPEEFAKLVNLKKLNLNDNKFVKFPSPILKLLGLESLAINYSYNILPDEICNLKNLRYLYMPNANISCLPENIGELEHLENLCIWGTKIKYLPKSCLNLRKIKCLYLTKSIYEHIIPPEIINQSALEAVNYIVKYQNDFQKKKINESKMIIVGQGGVGKTCLLNRLVYDKYDEKKSTEGIDIASWSFKYDEKMYKLNVWDFGGQEIYHATHQFFLTNRSLYIFVWDARQEEEYGRIDYWLHTIESFAFNSPILIVINKCDSRKSIKQLDYKSIKERFPQIIDYFKVSCKENTGIEDLKVAIKKETACLPLMDIVWLSTWLEVRRDLETMALTTNMITYKEYEDICSKHNILSAEALSLSKYLHDLGIIINFQKDLFLKNIIILNPEWGTNAVYKVLDAQESILKGRNGVLYYDDLQYIWDDENLYPKEIYPIILRLMENFQLSFEMKRNKEYLVAELLENEEITFELKENYKKCINFQYNYDFLPAGIMTRFIVKANEYLVEEGGMKICWKKGAYLQYEDSIGIVRLYDGITERKIEIKVMGDNNRNNKELLIIIRKFFEEIHKSVPKIKYKEYIKCNCEEGCTHLHDYRYLLRLEKNKIDSERCKNSLNYIHVSRLLDGIDKERENKDRRKRTKMTNIQVNPHIVVENINNNENRNIVQNEITIDIKNNINELQGCINDLKDEVTFVDKDLGCEFEKIENSLIKMNQANTKDELVQTGALKKIQRFINDVQDTESKLGNVIRGIKHGVDILQEIAEKYNSVAEWCGLPVVPKVFLKESK